MIRFQLFLFSVLLVLVRPALAGPPAPSADLSITKADLADPVPPGATFLYSIQVGNLGPTTAQGVQWTDTLPAGTTFVSLTQPFFSLWNCATPPVGSGGTITCSLPSFPPGPAGFTLVIEVDEGVSPGTVLTNTGQVSSATFDPIPANNASTVTTTVGEGVADLSIVKFGPAQAPAPGSDFHYSLTVMNPGPGFATGVVLTDTLPAGLEFISVPSFPTAWTCTGLLPGGTIQCSTPFLGPGASASFSVRVRVPESMPGGTMVTNTATVTSGTPDPHAGNNTSTVETTVLSPAALSATKTVAGSFQPGSFVSYTVVLNNDGPAWQFDNPGAEFTDVLPAGLTLVSATADVGMALATPTTNTVTWNGTIAGGYAATVTISAVVSAVPGTTISNQGSISFDADGNGINEASGVTDNPATASPDATSFVVAPGTAPAANIPTLGEIGLALLVLLLGVGGALTLRKRRT